jgi:hypothetical protein
MKDVEEKFSNRPVFRVPMQGAPSPRGYFIRYVSGMEDKLDIKAGHWLTQYFVDSDGYLNFNFEPRADLHWETEAGDRSVRYSKKDGGG